ncbi:MAG: type IX secretion system membrane protein PorP/SprF [Elusimicrobia bacterium]|nr:type IX secretion system membrane protein PorP/SprF [Elusimicrobiota bacterium]
MKRALAAFIVAAALARTASAAFEDMGSGARAPGMGDAFGALADDAYALHYNPAGLAQIDRKQFSAAYSRLYMGLSDGSEIGSSQFVYAHPLWRGKKSRTLGLGLDRLSLTGAYSEQTLTAAYGFKPIERESGAQLMTGFAAKYLTRSFTAPPEAANACVDINCGQGADPVLSGEKSKSAIDADLGLLYRFPTRWQMGLSVQHLTSPNVAFSGSDKLERAINLGLAYKSLWLSLIGEVRMKKTASGASGRDYVVAAERYFPTLDYGQFGVRGSLGVGSDEWRQITMGGSYRINKIQTDYAFLLPVGSLRGNSGSHRVSLTFHFGAPTGDEEISRELLEQAKRLHESGPDYGNEYNQELKPQDLNDPRLAEVRALIEQRKYQLAQKALSEYALKQPLNTSLIRLSNRLNLTAFYYQELPEPKDKYEAQTAAALRGFLYGEDRTAMLHASYAYSMKPEDVRITRFLEEMEKAVGVKADRLPPDHPRGFIDELLYRVEFAHSRGDQGRVEALLKDVIELEPESVTALERLGSLRYMAGRYLEAIQIWEAALKLETREKELESLRAYMKLAAERAGGSALPGGLAPAAPAAVERPSAAPAAAVAAPAAARPEPVSAAPRRAGDPRDVQALYQRGVEHYARGEYLQASGMFLRILQIDPENEQARKALERIDRRKPRR